MGGVPRPWTGADRASASRGALKTGRCSELDNPQPPLPPSKKTLRGGDGGDDNYDGGNDDNGGGREGGNIFFSKKKMLSATNKNIVATIHISRQSWCVPYAGFLQMRIQIK